MLAKIQLSSPYSGFEAEGIALDLQEWGSEHPYFQALVDAVRPKQIIEVGTWKGASAINLARHALALEPEVTVLCVDTWLGSNEVLWSDPVLRPLLKLRHGYPTVYHQFVANIIHEKLTETIFLQPMTSHSAAALLQKFAVQADLVYIGAGHDEYEV